MNSTVSESWRPPVSPWLNALEQVYKALGGELEVQR